MKRSARRRGVAAVLALIVLAMFTVLGVAHIRAANSSLLKAANLNRVHRARQQAESGLEYFTYILTRTEVPAGLTGESLVAAVAAALPAPLNTEISADDSDGGFTAALLVEGSVVTLTVRGRQGQVQRTVTMDFNLAPAASSIFDYAVAGMGKIQMSDNSRIQGANGPFEANVLSATYQTNKAFKLSDNARIDGDVYAPNPDAYAQLSGNASIGGENRQSEEIQDHIHIGIEDVEFPEVDPSVFESFAVNIVEEKTETNGNRTFTNIRIKAGADPDFSENVIVNGVVFIEKPNKVKFSDNATITGVIVTQDAGDGAHNANKIEFKDNARIRGVGHLPDESAFSGLKELPGSSLLAPGFGVMFEGDFGTIEGAMAAKCFTFDKDVSGTVRGPVISYGSEQIKLSGNSVLAFDRSGSPEVPPGFSMPSTLVAVPNTYREH